MRIISLEQLSQNIRRAIPHSLQPITKSYGVILELMRKKSRIYRISELCKSSFAISAQGLSYTYPQRAAGAPMMPKNARFVSSPLSHRDPRSFLISPGLYPSRSLLRPWLVLFSKFANVSPTPPATLPLHYTHTHNICCLTTTMSRRLIGRSRAPIVNFTRMQAYFVGQIVYGRFFSKPSPCFLESCI